MKGGCKDPFGSKNRVIEEQKTNKQEAQNVVIVLQTGNHYHASLCLGQGQLKLSASQLLPDIPPKWCLKSPPKFNWAVWL